MRPLAAILLCACACATATTLTACAPELDEELDGFDDDLVELEGKGDTGGIRPRTEDAYRVVHIANIATLPELRRAGLGPVAASNIVTYRSGDPGDPPIIFHALEELDRVPYVGPEAFARLLSLAKAKHIAYPFTVGEWVLRVDLSGDAQPLYFRVELQPDDGGARFVRAVGELDRNLRPTGRVVPAQDIFDEELASPVVRFKVEGLPGTADWLYTELVGMTVGADRMCGTLDVFNIGSENDYWQPGTWTAERVTRLMTYPGRSCGQ